MVALPRHRSGPSDVPHSASGHDRRRRRRCHLPVCGGGEWDGASVCLGLHSVGGNDSHHWYSSGRGVDGNSQWRPDADNFEWSAARGGRGDGGVRSTWVQ